MFTRNFPTKHWNSAKLLPKMKHNNAPSTTATKFRKICRNHDAIIMGFSSVADLLNRMG